jgi:hypothetical protein
MTSQHFGSAAEGWDEDWGDWGQESSNNNNVLKQQQAGGSGATQVSLTNGESAIEVDFDFVLVT